jgi:copper chaperone CopZ
LATVAGVTSVTVDLGRKVALVEGTAPAEAIKSKVQELGYDYVGEE